MTASDEAEAVAPVPGGPAGQTVVVVGGSSGIGLETARQVRAAGGDVILTARDPGRLERAAEELKPLSTAAFDAMEADRLEGFLRELPGQVDHVMVTAGSPSYTPLADLDLTAGGRDFGARLAMLLAAGRACRDKVRPGGTLLFIGGTGARRPAPGMAVIGALTAALPALAANLAVEIAPVRVNLLAAGFVDTPLSASLLGERLEERREELRRTLPIGRVVGPGDVASLALHIMANGALTGATYDIDGGQQLVAH
ncbi:SDR family oxidoreductase [Streptomyces sp. SS1-1]|uniref:SDR family oxidoreductase n=1 Tax=unclassified Streptomyces TaxID=2593676 RepID=UPI001250BB81|nr:MULTISPECIES: SDR family oxidoreductase [unclassified Streptomyces]KAB2975322.1 SDR family oxidoreductase [Streptomyces sp. SS1-1]MDI9830609.1 SDR family oxidoreductase [Streptomyces sp. KAU_LT]